MQATYLLQRLQICHDFFDIGFGVLFFERWHFSFNSTLDDQSHVSGADLEL